MALAKGFSTVEAAAEAAVRPIVESHGFVLWDVWFVKEGAKWYLRVFIDRAEGISIDDCESIDGLINEVIDKQDFIDKVDYVEIGSAGLERPIRRLAQLTLSVGKKVKVKTYKLVEGAPSKAFSGVLADFDGNNITVNGDFGEVALAVTDISGINYDDFDNYDI
ncbi:MAG: ribosome maturation factor RimP [Oscillospiraceae bacterium]|nr:ribosome maturation factor RimP [Oscillospiraceae bacterium]